MFQDLTVTVVQKFLIMLPFILFFCLIFHSFKECCSLAKAIAITVNFLFEFYSIIGLYETVQEKLHFEIYGVRAFLKYQYFKGF